MSQPFTSNQIKFELTQLFRQACTRVAPEYDQSTIQLERPKDKTHGDYACNLAMQLARHLKQNPRQIATLLLDALADSPYLEKKEIAGAGFINLWLSVKAKQSVIQTVLNQATQFGQSTLGQQQKTLVEFVSANPTGPLHVGHGRGAAYGAALCNLLEFTGFDVIREYYVNDAGRQMDILALSTWLRYLQQVKTDASHDSASITMPPNAYLGEYVQNMATKLEASQAGRFQKEKVNLYEGVPPLPAPEQDDDLAAAQKEAHLDALILRAKTILGESDWGYIHKFALTEQLTDCQEDLKGFGVNFDLWCSEQSLFSSQLVEQSIDKLSKQGHIYEHRGAKWFRSTDFGDEKDRVVQRENGKHTYFASDIAYHLNKYERGFDRLINIWGADHHGYIARIKGAIEALDLDVEKFHVVLVQFAVLYRQGEKASMSTRSGDFVTLRSLRDEVGKDACRLFYALRKSDQHLDFDLDLAKSKTKENPVYYIQYAHARISSVLSQARTQKDVNTEQLAAELSEIDTSSLTQKQELELANLLADFPELVERAAQNLAPHQIAFYLKDVASAFHAWYDSTRILVDDHMLSMARLALAAATQQVIRNASDLLGVGYPEQM